MHRCVMATCSPTKRSPWVRFPDDAIYNIYYIKTNIIYKNI